MYRTILVPVDGSDSSRDALAHALDLAATSNATVHVLSVVEPSGGQLAFGVDEVDDINRAVETIVDTIAANDDWTEVAIESDVRRGYPVYETILEYADEIGADLVVLGRRGTTSLPEAVFGRTTGRVARLADVPVTIVPEAGDH